MKRHSRDDAKQFRAVSTVILGVMTFFVLLPILLVVISSVTDENVLISSGYTFFPSKLSLDSYYYMVKQSAMILRAYGVTVTVTCAGTLLSVLITTMLAYPMSRPNFRYRNAMAFFVFFTMLFNGGIVASYIMWSRVFQIKDTIWALIIPNYLVTAFNVFLVRNYYVTSVPNSVIESAQIDGASELAIFFKIMLPLAIPTVATISLFTGLIYWNDWVNGLYYLTDPKLFGIQNLLIRIMNNIQFLKVSSNMALLGTMDIDLPGTSVRMAMAVIGILPIVVIYPLVQKHFIKGVVLGAIKG
ncbi:MAG: carbohydrate ABC transporter permease [Eubacteriales bacterium]|nr:carbohydrate ABC transporter permease [Eubacteriales bacterium]